MMGTNALTKGVLFSQKKQGSISAVFREEEVEGNRSEALTHTESWR